MVRSTATNSLTSRWSLALTLLLAGVLLLLAFRGVDWDEMLATVQRARLEHLALACVMLSVSYFIRGLRWRVLLSAEKLIAPLMVFWAIAVGYLGNSFLPARAGELIRAVMLGRSTNISKSYVLATAFTERITDVVALVLISLAALISLEDTPDWLLTAIPAMAVLGLVGMIGLFAAPRLEALFKRILAALPLPDTLRMRAVDLLEQFLLGMRAFQHPSRAASFLVLTLVIWLVDALVAITIAHALNLGLVLPEALLLLAALGLASAAPSTPGYVGIYQFVAVTVLAPFGFSRSEALVYILAFQAVSYMVVIGWGIIGLWRLRPDSSTNQTDSQIC